MKDTLKTTDEHELVLRLIEGDEEAFCTLYVRYKEKLLYFALKFLKSDEYAEDVLQDVFTHIWTGRRMINPDVPFSSYLYTIVKNRVLNELRNLQKQNMLREHILIHSLDYSEATMHQILNDDLHHIIHQAMSTMTPRQREVFLLSREGQLSYKEIAGKLNISVNTVHEHITSSLNLIRKFLIKYSDETADLILLLFLIDNF